MLLYHIISFSFAQRRVIVIDDSQQQSLQNISVLIDGSAPVEFLDNGISPDAMAQDSIHTVEVDIIKDTARMQFNSRGEKLNEINISIDQINRLEFVVQNNMITIGSTSSMRLFEYEVAKTPAEVEQQAQQSSDSISANISMVNQGSPVQILNVSLNGSTYALKDDGKNIDTLKGDNTWSVRITAQKQEKLQLQFDDGKQWKDTISISCSDKNEQNIQIIRMTDNFLLYGNEETPSQIQNNTQSSSSNPAPISNPPAEQVSTTQNRTFSEIPDSNEGDIYLLLILIGGLLLTFFIQIYLRWKRDIYPTLEEVRTYLQLKKHNGDNIMNSEQHTDIEQMSKGKSDEAN